MSAMNVMLIRTFFANSIPDALFEAAQIDGASQFQIFGNIVLPRGKPILVAMGLLSGLGYWNDWTNGLYYVRDTQLYGIQNLLNKMITDLTALTQNASGAPTVTSAEIPSASVRMAITICSNVANLMSVSVFTEILYKRNCTWCSKRLVALLSSLGRSVTVAVFNRDILFTYPCYTLADRIPLPKWREIYGRTKISRPYD